eukprot:GHVN01025662.1.p1 GENE.GHVN01025662.1~~GHVN01025662.1.p1  ORF type:complete len:187 (+),score=7.11 GHVN01025662.1:1316-1876(+)
MQEMWTAASGEAFAAATMKEQAAMYEDLVSAVALELFPHSLYVRQVENDIWSPPRQSSVYQALLSLRKTVAGYLRLCERRKRQVSIVNCKVLVALPKSVPLVVENDLRLQMLDQNIDIPKFAPVLDRSRAQAKEFWLAYSSWRGCARYFESTPSTNPDGECHCCGEKGHWRKDCRKPSHSAMKSHV